jgi:aminoglycoside phosphotransferase (APT) family kinase protein
MMKHVQGHQGPMLVEQFKGGQSNPTYKLLTPEKSYVIRRKPPGILLSGAHAVERELQVMHALLKTGYPVPQVFALCTDESVIGTSFYVMECVAGRIFWDVTFPQVSRDERPQYFDATNATIARLHCIDYRSIGLEGYGRLATILNARSRGGRSNTKRTSSARAVMSTWTVSSIGSLRMFRAATKRASCMGTSALTT